MLQAVSRKQITIIMNSKQKNTSLLFNASNLAIKFTAFMKIIRSIRERVLRL